MEKSVSCPHDSHPSLHGALVGVLFVLLNLWPYVSINHAFEGKFLSKVMFPRLEALDLQMNQIVYTFYTCFGASQQSNPMQTRGPFG